MTRKIKFDLPIEQRDDDIGDQVFTPLVSSDRLVGVAMDEHRYKLLKILRECRSLDEEEVLIWQQWPEARGPLYTTQGGRWEVTSSFKLVRKAWLNDWLEPLA
jgi:hypothetical protein